MDERTETLLDLYLDDALGADERAAFEARLAEDSELAAQLELQRSIDASLKSSFRPPAAAATNGSASLQRAGIVDCYPDERRTRWIDRRWIPLAAAGLFLTLAMGTIRMLVWPPQDPQTKGTTEEFAFGPALPPQGEPPPYAPPGTACVAVRAEWLAAYEAAKNPMMACGDLSWEDTVHGADLSLATTNAMMHERVTDPRLGDAVTAYTAQADASTVMVFITDCDRDPRPLIGELQTSAGPLSLFRRELGDLVLYELTPLDEARIVPHIEVRP